MNEKTIEEIHSLLSSGNYKGIRLALHRVDPADISDFFEDLNVEKSVELFRLIPKIRRSEVFSHLPFELQYEMLQILPESVASSLLNEMDPVDRTQLLEELPEEVQSIIIGQLNPEERQIAWQLLSYPEESIGRLMSPDFLAFRGDTSVGDVLAEIRWKSSRVSENLLNEIFIIDDDKMLMGRVSLARLVVADPSSICISDIMDDVLALVATDDEVVAVDHFRKYDKPCIPVIDEAQRLVGIVEADDVFDVAEEEATEDIQAFGGQASLEDSYLRTPILTLLKKRGIWLATIFLMMMFTANVLSAYEDSFRFEYLLIFLPLIISSGGNSGSQAASLIIRGFAIKDIDQKDWFIVLRREIVIGILLGLILGTLGFWRVFVIGDFGLAPGMIISLSLLSIVLFGAVTGSMLPFILKSIKLDPAVSSSPVVASLVDIFGIFALFNIAILIIESGIF
ncbi:MAG: magnesium transporter [Pseudobacteriovorax sp.]|nr:magnesium transporter [Pseudobacteriovorax sp.]